MILNIFGHYDYWTLCDRLMDSKGIFHKKLTVREVKENIETYKQKATNEISDFLDKVKEYLKDKNHIPYFFHKDPNKTWIKLETVKELNDMSLNSNSRFVEQLWANNIEDLLYGKTIESYVEELIEDCYFPFTFVTEKQDWIDFDQTRDLSTTELLDMWPEGENFTSFILNYLNSIPDDYYIWSIDYHN